MRFGITVDVKHVIDVLSTKDARAVVANVTNILTRRARKDSKTRILSRYNLRSRDVNIQLRRASPHKLTGYIFGYARKLSLIRFRPRETRTGVSVEVERGNRFDIPHAFIAQPHGRDWKKYGQHGQLTRKMPVVFLRSGGKAYPVYNVAREIGGENNHGLSVSIGQLVRSNWNEAAIQAMIGREAPRLFDEAVRAKLTKRGVSAVTREIQAAVREAM